uniref:Uncharacterized protein n=1 Tax=Lactuca sativa TaxID=4236 RepID=A0A9R1VTF4_LACSA|nr:hypothetical protein LSAT_V11C400195830 [Lactuca sativa]
MQRGEKKFATSSIPPPYFPVFFVDPDFIVLRLQPYVPVAEVVLEKYFFHDYKDFWSLLFRHKDSGWLDKVVRLLMERHFKGDRYTIMPPTFFVFHAQGEGFDLTSFASRIATYPTLWFLGGMWIGMGRSAYNGLEHLPSFRHELQNF